MTDLLQAYSDVNRRPLAQELLDAGERDRSRIADLLQGDLAQVLASVLFGLTGATEQCRHGMAEPELLLLKRELQTAIARVQSFATLVRPSTLSDFGLAQAVRSLCACLPIDPRLVMQVQISANTPGLSEGMQLAVYRILEAAIRNAVDHAKAAAIKVALSGSSGRLSASVEDDGKGFDVSPASLRRLGGSGLLLMTVRATLLDAALEIDSQAGAGTRVSLTVPLQGRES